MHCENIDELCFLCTTVWDVLEEIYHFGQNKRGLNNGKNLMLRTVLNEIDAKEYLISVAEKYKIPDEEVRLTIDELNRYRKMLQEME